MTTCTPPPSAHELSEDMLSQTKKKLEDTNKELEKLEKINKELKNLADEARKRAEWGGTLECALKNDELRAKNDELRAKNDELRAKNDELRAENDELRAENDELNDSDLWASLWTEKEVLLNQTYSYSNKIESLHNEN